MIWETLTAFFRATASVFGFVNKRQDLKNAEDVRAAEIAQKEVDGINAIEDHVARKNTDEVRKDIAG